MIRMEALGRVAGVLLAGVVGAAGMTDAEIDAKFAAMGDYMPAVGTPYTEEGFADFLKELVADICLQGEEIGHLERLTPLFMYHPDTRRRMRDRLERLQAGPGVAGARASVMGMVLRVRGATPAEMAAAVEATLAHPGLGESIRAGRASDLFSILRGLPREALEPNAEAIAALVGQFDESMPRRALAVSSDYRDVVRELEGVLKAERVAGILARFDELYAAAAPGEPGSASEDEKTDMQEHGGVVHKKATGLGEHETLLPR